MYRKTEPLDIQAYLEDASAIQGGHAEEVVFCENEKEIAEFLREMSDKKIPVTVAGGRTSVTGAVIPFGGKVLATDPLNKIIDLRKDSIIVQPAVTVETLEKTVAGQGLYYPADPTEHGAWLGGNVATNASGARSFKYGPTRRWAKRLRVVLTNGKVLEIKRGEKLTKLNLPFPTYHMPKVKNAAGYYIEKDMDLIDLFIGQEGTLGIVTEIELGLRKAPEKIFSCVAFFSSFKEAIDFVLEARQKLKPLSLEILDYNSLELLRSKYSHMPKEAKAAIFFEEDIDGDEDKVLDRWGQLLEKYGVSLDDTWSALNPEEYETLRLFRHALPERINEIVKGRKQAKRGTDMAVPDDKLKKMIDYYRGKLEETGLEYVIFGHIGNNHLHVNMLPKDDEETDLSKKVYLDLVKKAVEVGGTVSAEHGIGKLKHKYLEVMYGKKGLQEMAILKKALDPDCILGRGNIFPVELLTSAAF